MIRLIEKPKVIIYRFLDVIITKGRIKNDYIQVVCENIFDFLQEFWGDPELMRLVDEIRDQSYDDHDTFPVTPIVFKESQNPRAIQDSVCLYVNWKCKHSGQPEVGSYKQPHNQMLRLVMLYSLAMDKGLITVHERFAKAVKERHEAGIRQIVLSRITSTLIDHNRQIMSFTTMGELTKYFDGYFSTTMYSPTEPGTYEDIANILNVLPGEMLLISSSARECRMADEAYAQVVKIKLPGDPNQTEFFQLLDMSSIQFGPREPPQQLSLKTSSRKNRNLRKNKKNKKHHNKKK